MTTTPEPSGDPVEQLAARQAGVQPVREFPDKAPPPSLGDPATDPPFTWRVHPSDPPLDLHARRALRTSSASEPWVLVSSSQDSGGWLSHVEVRDWPYTSHLHAGAAVGLAARRAGTAAPEVVQSAERGDLDVDSFKGGKS